MGMPVAGRSSSIRRAVEATSLLRSRHSSSAAQRAAQLTSLATSGSAHPFRTQLGKRHLNTNLNGLLEQLNDNVC